MVIIENLADSMGIHVPVQFPWPVKSFFTYLTSIFPVSCVFTQVISKTLLCTKLPATHLTVVVFSFMLQHVFPVPYNVVESFITQFTMMCKFSSVLALVVVKPSSCGKLFSTHFTVIVFSFMSPDVISKHPFKVEPFSTVIAPEWKICEAKKYV